MAIFIKNRFVYSGRKKIGFLRAHCCGFMEFHDIRTSGVFYISKIRSPQEPRLKICIGAIQSIKIPKGSFGWNFHHETAVDKIKLAAYEKELNNWNKK